MTTPLQKAAQAMIARWDSPAWKDQPHTAEYIAELRKALDAEIAQSVEPVSLAKTKTEQVAGAISRHISTPLLQREVIAAAQYIAHRYMHPPQPQATTAVPEGYVLVPIEPTPAMWAAVNKLDDEMSAGNYGGRGCSIEQAWECLLSAAQGEKP